jgi:dihydroorotate dehydrogenase
LFRAFSSDPEAIHERMIKQLSALVSHRPLAPLVHKLVQVPGRPTTVAGINFPSRVGLAAGMDKDGLAVKAWAPLGFGFAELGTVTHQPQPGNPKPRVFRLVASKAIINRMGFNNQGALALANRLEAEGIRRGNGAAGIPIGISIGKTKVVPIEKAVPDYLMSLESVARHADYVAINVSSPNTPELRKLQGKDFLGELMRELTTTAANLAVRYQNTPIPLFLKVAPDLEMAELDRILMTCEDAGISGIIATNTTITRPKLAKADQPKANEPGGLSGAPLTRLSRKIVGYITAHTKLPVIASGGIMRPHDATAMFDLGAQLVQVYTGFIYSGPALLARINTSDLRNEPLWGTEGRK